jgi:hypothetical protein
MSKPESVTVKNIEAAFAGESPERYRAIAQCPLIARRYGSGYAI